MQIKEIQIFKIIINNKHKKFIFLSFLFSVFFVFQIFKFLSRDQFIFSGDMYFPLSIDEIVKNFFFVFALNDFGDFDGIKSILSFFDNLLFFFLYLISQNIHLVQILYFFFLFFYFFLINYL